MIPERIDRYVRADYKSSPAERSAFFNGWIEGAGWGQNAMIKSETTDTIPLLRVVQQSSTIDHLPLESKQLFNTAML
ncbi:MAG: hypothetical protein PHH91_11630 [Desulfuromonadaceae bacterium]|nr:hypothetical protein [Desulfuromonadaceae bacterium]